jgi:signal transduction histidine kinase
VSEKEKVNILMVDDQPAKLLSYEVILAELGENLIQASCAREALEFLLKNDIAVVLMDVSMPEMDGFELAEMIRQHPRFLRTAIIFISAVHLTDLDRIKGYQRGAVDYISVPVVPELLRAKVSLFAELHRKTRQLEQLNEELRKLSWRVIASQDEERRRVARELHDGLGQELVAAKILIHRFLNEKHIQVAKQSANEASVMIDRAIQQVRSMSHLLHPPLLDQVGLLSALHWYVDGFTERSGIHAALDVQPENFPRLSKEAETAIFRIVQESLVNVFRHSEARNVWINLHRNDMSVVTSVRDDGKGIGEGIAEMRPGRVGIGIEGMRQRAKELGGDLRLASANPGTLLELVIPFIAHTSQEFSAANGAAD